MLALAAPAEAARKVPRGFYGVSYDGEVRNASDGVQDAGVGAGWRANGVESSRTVFSWAHGAAGGGRPSSTSARPTGSSQDAAEHGVELLPIVMDTPLWARAQVQNWWPRADRGLRRLRRRARRAVRAGRQLLGRARRTCRSGRCGTGRSSTSRALEALRAAARGRQPRDQGRRPRREDRARRPDRHRGRARRGTSCATSTATAGSGAGSTSPRSTCTRARPANVVEGVRLFRQVMKRQRRRREAALADRVRHHRVEGAHDGAALAADAAHDRRRHGLVPREGLPRPGSQPPRARAGAGVLVHVGVVVRARGGHLPLRRPRTGTRTAASTPSPRSRALPRERRDRG